MKWHTFLKTNGQDEEMAVSFLQLLRSKFSKRFYFPSKVFLNQAMKIFKFSLLRLWLAAIIALTNGWIVNFETEALNTGAGRFLLQQDTVSSMSPVAVYISRVEIHVSTAALPTWSRLDCWRCSNEIWSTVRREKKEGEGNTKLECLVSLQAL